MLSHAHHQSRSLSPLNLLPTFITIVKRNPFASLKVPHNSSRGQFVLPQKHAQFCRTDAILLSALDVIVGLLVNGHIVDFIGIEQQPFIQVDGFIFLAWPQFADIKIWISQLQHTKGFLFRFFLHSPFTLRSGRIQRAVWHKLKEHSL